MDATNIAVSATNDVIKLTRLVRRYSDKYEAEVAAKRVSGVVGVANDIEVHLPSSDEARDPEIARDAVSAIRVQLSSAWEKIRVVVRNGWVNQEGELEWNFQRELAESAVRRLKGVKNVADSIHITPSVVRSCSQ